jgi:hypothetical protein
VGWSKSGRIQRPQAWAVTGAYRELVRRLPRCAGSRRRLLALAERRARGMGELGATREEAAALAGWRGPLAPDEGQTADGGGAHVAEPGPREV